MLVSWRISYSHPRMKAPRGGKEREQMSLGVVWPSFWGHVSFLRVSWLFTREKFLSISGTWDSRAELGVFCGVFVLEAALCSPRSREEMLAGFFWTSLSWGIPRGSPSPGERPESPEPGRKIY